MNRIPGSADPSAMITTSDDLRALADRIRSAGAFGIDMEFQRERTYFAKLCLVQVAVPTGPDSEELALIDPFEFGNLDVLWDLMSAPDVEVTLHAGSQDMEIMFQQCGRPPANVFDTQIGAALIGYGDQPGYATLVDRILSVRLSKLETVTDWVRRPLTPGQIDYALDDVRYLYPVRRHIRDRLDETGRLGWAVEEMSHYEDRDTYEKDPRRLYLRLPRTRSLGRRNLAILRELAAWREEEAMRRDVPRNRVVADDVLIEVAKRSPKKKSDLAILRGMHSREIERSGDGILAAVRTGAGLPESEWPEPPEGGGKEDPEASLAVDLMEVLLRSRARENGIAPSCLGTRRDIAALFEAVRAGTENHDPAGLLAGWRRELVGNELVGVLRGERTLHIDPRTGHVEISPR